MKKSLLFLTICTSVFGTLSAQDANLSLGNLSSYYDKYDNATKMISGLELVVGADGDNSNNYISTGFEVSVYLLACNSSGTATSSTPVFIKVYTVPGGTLHQMGTYTFSNQSIDLSKVSGLADGMYRMGAWINSNKAIANPPDDQNDNAGLLQSSGGSSSSSIIKFTGAVTGIAQSKGADNLAVSVYPNPVTVNTVINFEIGEQQMVALKIYDITGKLIKTVADKNFVRGNYMIPFDSNDLAPGIYYCAIITEDDLVTKKIVKQ